MRWRKLGLIAGADRRSEWISGHAMIPTPLPISRDRLRIYLGYLDERSVGRIGYLDVASDEPTRALAQSDTPVLDIGRPGAFDDNGVVPSCIVRAEDGLRLYYSGFQLQTKVPYTIFTGLALAAGPDGPFHRLSEAPILDRTAGELYFRASPWVIREGDKWRMWYIGGDGWNETPRKTLPSYSLRYIESEDGIHWPGPSQECLAPDAPHEIGFGRPVIVRDGAMHRMWYSIRTREGYSLGYATSRDGLAWTRDDGKVGIRRAESGWDSEMICYAGLVETAAARLMFYNGNGYGRTGVGVAAGEPDERNGD